MLRDGRYLRDARHLDKFMYLVDDELFYKPLDTYYQPTDNYKAVVSELIGDSGSDWIITRDGFWFHVHPRQDSMPLQGWKVHVSATARNAATVLKKAAAVALSSRITFKFALDQNVLSLMGSKRWHRGGSGKFITFYPHDAAAFQNLLESLYAELRHEEGPYILSDRRYKDCRVLYYRYGGMARNSRMDMMGLETPVLVAPNGDTVADTRTPYFAPPAWVTDPFPAEESDQGGPGLNGGKYIVKRAMAFSNSGGVYGAEENGSAREVVIKEARPHTVVDDWGNDAIHRLKKEFAILEVLKDTGITPAPLAAFQEWENFFLAEEFVEGIDIRDLMLSQCPILKVRPTLEDGGKYYQVFRKVFRNVARAIDQLHQRNIVFGDLSPVNIKVVLETCAVRLIDLEVAYRPGIDLPTYLFTPGFKKTLSGRKETAGFADDLYSLASVMLYSLFPIASFSTLRTDLFEDVLKAIIADVGWEETDVFQIIGGLAKNEISCAQVCELLDLDKDKPARVLQPHFVDDVDLDFCHTMTHELGRFVLAHMGPREDGSLFPADPLMNRTNPLSWGFGGCGVLYSLTKSSIEVPQSAYDWLEQTLDRVDPAKLPPGLFTGAAGIAWNLGELGYEDRAAELMNVANESPLLKQHHSYFYGMAGVGMANLYMFTLTGKSEYLTMAIDLGDRLLKTAQENERGIFWEADSLVHLGYGYGQSGVALFFLRLSQLSGDERFLVEGRRALEFDLSHGRENEAGVLSFPRGPLDHTIEPYLEEGSAGVAKVAMRYGVWEPMEKILSDVHRKYAVFPGLMYGLGSFVDILTDAFLFTKDTKYLEMAKRPIAGLRDIYLMKRPEGWATPGDGLFRISCDYATGVSGVLRTMHRYTHGEQADFVLDEVAAAPASFDELFASHLRSRSAAKSA